MRPINYTFNTAFFFLVGALGVFLVKAEAQTAGTLDSTYGTNGKGFVSFTTGVAFSGVVQSDGKVVVTGYSLEGGAGISVTRFTLAGTIDSTFGTNGKTVIHYLINPIVYAAAVQPDDRIVLAGSNTSNSDDYDIMVVRLNANGTLDSTFGTNGIVITAERHAATVNLGITTEARAVAIQPDGRIVVAGRTYELNYDAAPIIVRYDSTGARDSTFNGSGVVVDSTYASLYASIWINSMALQPDGKILVAGSTNSLGSSYGLAVELMRFNSDGSLDNGFASDTRYQKTFGTTAEANSVALLPDGSILLAGYSGTSNSDFYLVKYNSSGHVDNSFGGTTDGVTLSLSSGTDDIYACSVTPAGNILVAGTASNNFGAAQFSSDGTLDTTFASSGTTTIDMGGSALARSIAFSPGGQNFFLIGQAGTNFAVAKIFSYTAATTPTATTNAASSIAPTSARLDGTVNPDRDTTTVKFIYGTASGVCPDTVAASQSPIYGYLASSVSATISGLTANKTYYYRVIASNPIGSAEGSEVSFMTLQLPSAPTATTDSVSSIASTTAISYGTVNPNGDTTTVRFLYGIVSGTYYDSVIAAQSPLTGYSSTHVTANLSGLTPGQTYYLRVSASSILSYERGSEISFTTVASTETAPSGSGTSSDPHIIAGLDNLKWLQDASNDTAWGDYYKQTANINASPTSTWNSGTGLSPIGNSSTPFSGSYDGQGHTIDSLHISRTGSNYQGLFGTLGSSAVVESLGVRNASVSGNDFVGALAGWVESGASVTSCYTSGSVYAGHGDCGGLIGENDGSVSESFSNCNVTGGSNYSMGGLIGYSYSGTITNCYSTGEVNVGCPGAGGLVGNHTGAAIVNCYSVSKVIASSVYGGLIGGQYGGTASSSFYDTDSTSSSAAGTGATSAQMKTESTYTGASWDFSSTWAINGSLNNGYPYLAGVDHSLAVQATDFVATADVGSVTIKWKTQSEVGNAGFSILREDPGTSTFKLISSCTSDDSLRGLGTSSTGRSYDFIDSKVISGDTYTYKIQSVSANGTTKDLSTLSVTVDVPKTYALYQNYPNPFNPTTTIRFDLKEQSNMMLDIYNVLGQKVEERDYGLMSAGRFNEVVDMNRFSSGVYLYRIEAIGIDGQKFSSIKKLMLMK